MNGSRVKQGVMGKKKKGTPAVFTILVKVGNLESGEADMKKWRIRSVTKTLEWLNKEWPQWRYWNLYCKECKGQLDYFTNGKVKKYPFQDYYYCPTCRKTVGPKRVN